MNARKAKQRGRGASRYKQIDRLVVGRLSTTYARTHSNTVMLVTAIRASTMVILANYRADQNFNKAHSTWAWRFETSMARENGRRRFHLPSTEQRYSRINRDHFEDLI